VLYVPRKRVSAKAGEVVGVAAQRRRAMKVVVVRCSPCLRSVAMRAALR